MKFIHCADLHFDSRLRFLPSEKASIRNNELLRTFKNMVSYAQSNEISLILICGDMFDSQTIKVSTRKFLQTVIEEAQSVKFLYIRGNHDQKCVFFEKNPQNFYEFEDFSELIIDGISFGGVPFCKTYLSKINFTHSPSVCLLHGSTIDGEIDLKALAYKNITYLALGDIHKPCIDKVGNMTWSYPGCLEGRGFDETEKRGFNVVDIDSSGNVSVTFVPFASRLYHSLSLDVSNNHNNFMQKIENAVIECINDRSKEDLYKITLTGFIEEDDIIDTNILESNLSKYAFFVKVENETKLKIDLNKIKLEEMSLKSKYLEKVFSSTLSDEEKNKIAMLGIMALRGEDLSL